MYARGRVFKPWLFQSFERVYKLRSRLYITQAVDWSIKQKLTTEYRKTNISIWQRYLSYIYYKICSFCICDTDKSYVHVSRHSISKVVSVQKLIKHISLPWEKKPYHQMIGSHTHVTHIIPREKKPYHQMIG